MWRDKQINFNRNVGFFRIGLSHDSLENHYQTNFNMMQHHKYSLSELDTMLPWERQIYIALLQEYVEKENERIRKQNGRR